ncbi:MAG: hypothetical protein VKJ04_03085 [Vampirovibrionales bacterium]|nr:hypothetical protein [Vampirovibrionales bacterium]
MAQQFPPNTYQAGSYTGVSGALPQAQQFSVLVFLRGLATPVVLYAENPTQVFDEVKGIIRQADPKAPKLIEKAGMGPLKKVAFLDIEVTGVALQSDLTAASR